MAEVILVTGGCRSGKSAFAERLVREAHPARRFYIATCPVLDAEMRERVRLHQARRAADHWTTIEEQTDLVSALKRCGSGVVLVDCLTLWISNLMYAAEQKNIAFTEDEMRLECERFQRACTSFEGTIVLVINEVGSGIVPENAMAREYRDIAGWVNQQVADAADSVFYCVAGQAVDMKKLAFKFEEE